MPPTGVYLSYLVQQGAHTCKHVCSSRTCISPSSSLSLEGRKLIQTIPYKLQTCTLLLFGKDFFPYVGQGIKKDRGLQQADSTLHHAPHRHQQKPSENLRLATHFVCILHASPPQVFKGGHLQYFKFAWDE